MSAKSHSDHDMILGGCNVLAPVILSISPLKGLEWPNTKSSSPSTQDVWAAWDPLERGVPVPSCWDEKKNISKACSTGKEHQESGVRECSYLQSGIRPLSGVECTLQNPSHIFGGRVVTRDSWNLGIREYERRGWALVIRCQDPW